MKFIFFALLLPSLSFANNQIEVPFKGVAQKVVVKVEKSRCSADGEKAYKLETVVVDQEYNLVCKLRPPVDQYDSTTPVKIIHSFKYPEAILKDIESSSFEDLKRKGVKAIKKRKHSWGTEYTWSTPTYGTAVYTYLCPKKSEHCFRAIHGGIEFLTFEIKNNK